MIQSHLVSNHGLYGLDNTHRYGAIRAMLDAVLQDDKNPGYFDLQALRQLQHLLHASIPSLEAMRMPLAAVVFGHPAQLFQNLLHHAAACHASDIYIEGYPTQDAGVAMRSDGRYFKKEFPCFSKQDPVGLRLWPFLKAVYGLNPNDGCNNGQYMAVQAQQFGNQDLPAPFKKIRFQFVCHDKQRSQPSLRDYWTSGQDRPTFVWDKGGVSIRLMYHCPFVAASSDPPPLSARLVCPSHIQTQTGHAQLAWFKQAALQQQLLNHLAELWHDTGWEACGVC